MACGCSCKNMQRFRFYCLTNCDGRTINKLRPQSPSSARQVALSASGCSRGSGRGGGRGENAEIDRDGCSGSSTFDRWLLDSTA